jgi:hypothetical protein
VCFGTHGDRNSYTNYATDGNADRVADDDTGCKSDNDSDSIADSVAGPDGGADTGSDAKAITDADSVAQRLIVRSKPACPSVDVRMCGRTGGFSIVGEIAFALRFRHHVCFFWDPDFEQ